ncbi:MAG: hypothetical protein ACI3W5_07770 [Faecousia sp.]
MNEERVTAEDIERTKRWLEDGRQKAATHPSRDWDILIRAGEQVLSEMTKEHNEQE